MVQIKVHEFVSVCIHLMKETNQIIQHVSQNQIFNKILKPDETSKVEDFATDADIKAQDIIIKGLQSMWPDLKIVGEEDVRPQSPWKCDISHINSQILLPEYFKDNESFELDDAIVWIDPLDGTLSYIKGEMDCVTTLIGVSVKGKPILGLIGKPYKKNGDGYDFSPMTYFAHANMNKIYYTYEKDIKSKVLIPYELDKPQLDENRFSICSSSHRLTQEAKTAIEKFNPTILVQFGGAGNKFLQILLGNVDMYYYKNKGGLKRWDTCAPEALLKAWGGMASGLDGKEYDYVIEPPYENANGICATLNKKRWEQVMQAWGKE